ncbi:MAG: MBL fold metallo-hydrolase [Vulcanimicrobiota bacterium]
MNLQFLGAAGTVTGSKFYLTDQNHKVLVDAGMFQGPRRWREQNWKALPLDPAELSAVVLTHAHIDHTGYLPRLGRDGLKAPVHCTWGTRDLAKILLPDAARLQEEEAHYRNRKKKSKHHPALPLFNIVDAEQVLDMLVGHRYDTPFEPVRGWKTTYRDAGHILGSAWVDMKVGDKRIVFSGDLGRVDAPILRDPVRPEGRCDVLLLESTYGNRTHPDTDNLESLAEIVMEVAGRKGTLVIPAFAVERTQEILYLLEELIRRQDIPKLPVFIDSPMAVKATRLFAEYREYYDEEATALVKRGEKVFNYKNLTLCESVKESKAILQTSAPKIIISASGMATGGRILHHLRNYLPHPKNHVLMVGYQSVGTRGWRLLRGEKEIKIFGDFVKVRAGVSKLEGFSGHADCNGVLDWCDGFSEPPGVTYLVHGEPDALEAQAASLRERGWNVIVPEYAQEFELW